MTPHELALMGRHCRGGLRVQDLFQPKVWTGNGVARSIVNDLDLSGNDGSLFIGQIEGTGTGKGRVWDTLRGAQNEIECTANNETTNANGVTAFNSNGFDVGTASHVNRGIAGCDFLGLAFRKAVNFHDVITYTGNGGTRSVAHGLGSAPGFLLVKARTGTNRNWVAWHRSVANTTKFRWDTSDSASTDTGYLAMTTPDASYFTIGNSAEVNGSGVSYVAYLWAHNPDLCYCGSLTTFGTTSVNLGWEPQFLMIKRVNGAGHWLCFDTARGWTSAGGELYTFAQGNTQSYSTNYRLLSDGFQVNGVNSGDYVFLAIRKP